MKLINLAARIPDYLSQLCHEEKSPRTVKKYARDVQRFFTFAADEKVVTLDFALIREYSLYLLSKYKASTCNSYLISLNSFLRHAGVKNYRVRLCRVQRRFCLENELSTESYWVMLNHLAMGNNREGHELYLLLRTLGSTGIRVGELPAITRQTAERGWAEILLKGKLRQVFLPKTLCVLLLDYCDNNSIQEGAIFRSRDGTKPLNSTVVWRRLKRLAFQSGVDEARVYPHNLRHMFARVYMETYNNIVELADLLGHSSIETTRIYVRNSSTEMIQHVSALPL